MPPYTPTPAPAQPAGSAAPQQPVNLSTLYPGMLGGGGLAQTLANLHGGSKPESEEEKRKRLLAEQAAKASGFASQGERGFNSMTGDLNQQRAQLQDIATGKLSYSKEALRQGLMQNQAAQRSMAAGASPQNQAMAARTAMINSGRLGAGMSGQSALAGIAEQQGAMKLGADLAAQQRQQDLMAALQSRQNAMGGYSAGNAGAPEKSWLEKYGSMIIGGATMAAGAGK